MDQFLSEAKRLVQRLQHHDTAVDILIGETTNLQNKLIAMRQYKDEVVQMNQNANHRPRSTLILGSQLENQRIQGLEQENRELNISLAEHQSALEFIMNKYREQVLVMMKTNSTPIPQALKQPSEKELEKEVAMMSEQINEMAYVMRQSASIDESVAAKEFEIIRSLQMENDNLRELLQISGQSFMVDDTKPEHQTTALPTTPSSIMPIDASVSNKDSGIYDEEFSPNFDVIKGKRRKPFKNSKHIDNLENLFKSPEINPKIDNLNNSVNDADMTDYENETQHQIYTVEALVEKNDDSKENEQLVNGEINYDADIPDSNSSISIVHKSNVNKEFKEIVTSNLSNADNLKIDKAEDHNDVLQFLDDALNFSDDEEENVDDEINGKNDKQCLELTGTTMNNITITPEGNLDLESKKNQAVLENTVSNDITESEALDFLDNFDKELESGMDDFHSDAESEVTITEDIDENGAMAMFDSVLDDELDFDENDEES